MLRPAYTPTLPGMGGPQYSLTESVAQADPALARIDRVWVEGDTIDADGYTGLRVHALVHARPQSRLIFSAHFQYDDNSPVRSDQARYRDAQGCAASSTDFLPSGGVEQVTAFLPRGAMLLEPGAHSVQVVAALLDDQGRAIATAPAIGFTARRDQSYITRVHAERSADPFGNAGGTLALKVSFVLDHALNSAMGRVVAQFKDARGAELVGSAPYANGAHGLMAYKDFASHAPWGMERFDDVVVTLPARLVPQGASALVMVEDASTQRNVTAAVPYQLP